MHTALQEAAKAHLSGAPAKKSLNFLISQEWEALPTPLEEDEVLYENLNPKGEWSHVFKSNEKDHQNNTLEQQIQNCP